MMRVLLVLLLLVYTIGASKPPKIHVENLEIQEHHSIGKFIELKEHDSITLKCSGPNHELKFVPPNMNDHYGYNNLTYEERYEEIDDEYFGDRVLTINNVQESDTGTYTCISVEHQSINDTVHLFVYGANTFVLLTAEYFLQPEGQVVVPCKTTKYIENSSDIELYANDVLIKAASKNYDQRFGFKITNKIYDEKIQEVKFRCNAKKEKNQDVSYIITERDSPISDDDFKFYWDTDFEWPHVGYNYSLACRLAYTGPSTSDASFYEHNLFASCPQCSNKHVTSVRARDPTTRTYAVLIHINSLELEDSGSYKCTWNKESRKEDVVIEHQLQVAPNKAQIKVIDRSPHVLKVSQAHEVSLFAKFAIYPNDEEHYTAKWSRRYNSSIKEGVQSETIITDDFRTISPKSFKNGVFSETLVIKDNAVTTNMSGTYILSISHLDTVQVVQWEVAIESDEPDVQITVREPSSFIVFNQQFYPPNTHLHIDCVSISIPPANVIFAKKNRESSEFEEIRQDLLMRVDGTFESGYIWNMTLETDTELRCQSETRRKKSSTTKTIIVAEEALHVFSKIEKSSQATGSEDEKVIYEGDHVILTCVVPIGATDWNVFWRFEDGDSISLPSEVKEEKLSKHVILHLMDITASSSGRYVCVVKKGDSEELLESVVKVEKTLKPYHIEADSRHVITVEFDQTFSIDCHMAGNPTPDYQWFKNGNPYTKGEQNGRSLKVTRSRAEDDGQFHCLATNRAGSTSHFIEVQVEGVPKGSSFFYWVLAILFLLFICAVVILMYKLRATKKITKQKDIALTNLYRTLIEHNAGPLPEEMKELPIEERTYYLPYNTDYEIDPANLEILDILGQGHFGFVRKGYLQMADPKSQIEYKTRLPVAIKSSSNPYDVELQTMMAEELKIMCAIPKHPNVLCLIGAVTSNMRKGELFIVTEYIDCGALHEYLRKNRNHFKNELVEDEDDSPPVDDSYMVPNSVKKKKYKFDGNSEEHDRLLSTNSTNLCTSDLLSFGLQIANGMEWLASIPCVHRDLACRNVLVTKSKIIRIADFGLAKRHADKSYYRVKKNKEQKLPVRCMSLEAIEELKFTQKSDIWSFGICLYEIFTLGGIPYPGLDTIDIIDYIRKGHRNSQPEYCHDDIYELMKLCWKELPKDRPNFSECIHFLKNHIKTSNPELLQRVDNMLHLEKEEQLKLDEWIQKSRPDVPGTTFKKSPKKPTDERYLIVESHA